MVNIAWSHIISLSLSLSVKILWCSWLCFSCPGVIIGSSQNCSSNSLNCTNGITLRPCCLGLHSMCYVISQQNCAFLGGHWHKDKVCQPWGAKGEGRCGEWSPEILTLESRAKSFFSYLEKWNLPVLLRRKRKVIWCSLYSHKLLLLARLVLFKILVCGMHLIIE